MTQLTRGQRVLAVHPKHGTHAGQVAVISTNGNSIGILLDEPFATRSSVGLLVSGALMFLREGSVYRDFWGEEWDVTAQEPPAAA